MGLPNFFLIGAGKAGTTAIAHHLDSHPEAFVCKPKEPRFMCYPEGRPEFKGPGDERLYVPASLSEYEALFRQAGNAKAVGDASTWYLTHPDAPENIRKLCPASKIIAILRNPCDRALSHWMHLVREQVETEDDFISACKAEQTRKAAGHAPHWWYVSQSRYYEGLERYFKLFSKDQILIHLYEDFVESPEKVVAETYRFLGVSADHNPDFKEKLNIGGIPKNKRLQEYLEQSAWGGNDPLKPIKALFPKQVRSSLRRHITRANLVTDRSLTDKERAWLAERL
ncbi:MAG: sulfotransferase, partial [Pseudomonadota bacterium]